MVKILADTKLGRHILGKVLTQVLSKKFEEMITINVSKFEIHTDEPNGRTSMSDTIQVDVSGTVCLSEKSLNTILEQVI